MAGTTVFSATVGKDLHLSERLSLRYEAAFWNGSLHVTYADDETAVALEFADAAPGLGYRCQWLDARGVLARSDAVVVSGLQGGLWSDTEVAVDPQQIIATLPAYLA